MEIKKQLVKTIILSDIIDKDILDGLFGGMYIIIDKKEILSAESLTMLSNESIKNDVIRRGIAKSIKKTNKKIVYFLYGSDPVDVMNSIKNISQDLKFELLVYEDDMEKFGYDKIMSNFSVTHIKK